MWVIVTMGKVLLHLIQSGAWISVLFLALVEPDSTTTFMMRLRILVPKFLIFNLLMIMSNQPTINANRFWRHGRHDFLPLGTAVVRVGA